MEKAKGKIKFTFSPEGLHISVISQYKDLNVDIFLDQEQTVSAMSRLGSTECRFKFKSELNKDILELEGKITLLYHQQGFEIGLKDEKSGIYIFNRVEVNQTESLRCMSSLYADCDLHIASIQYVGKKVEMQRIEMEIEEKYYRKSYKECPNPMTEYIKSNLNGGSHTWDTFSGKDSYFNKGGKFFVRTNIKRWVD